MLHQVGQGQSAAAYSSHPVDKKESLLAGATSVISSSARQAFQGLADAISFPWRKPLTPKEKVATSEGPLYKRETSEKIIQKMAAAFASPALAGISVSMEDSEMEITEKFVSALTGKLYNSDEATAFDNFVYDILNLAQDDDFLTDGEMQERLSGLDKIGAGNAATILAAGHQIIEKLVQYPSLSQKDIQNFERNKENFKIALANLLKKNPEAHQKVSSGDLVLDLTQVDPAFIQKLEKQEDEEKAAQQSDNKTNRILGVVFIALALGAAAAAGYSMYRSHQASLQPKPSQPKPSAPAPSPAASAPAPQPVLPEDMCQEPETKFCENNFGIPRIKMPQMDKEVTQQFLNHWKGQNVAVTEETIPSSSLYSTQGEILRSKVMGMVKSQQEGKFNPCEEKIIVAQRGDNHILDGHHRWAACKVIDQPLKVVRIDRPIQELLETANRFAGVEHHDLHHVNLASKA